ncbi:GNAT family N-acetyltransferase [Pelomyxa schiedti]|nr:GNAT family N-acetyltransferase [Pelomyxa schiedti]
MAMTFRRATESDHSTIVEFQQRMAHETEGLVLDPSRVSRGVAAVLAGAPAAGGAVYYAAECDGALVGCLMITLEWSDWRDGVVWWIQSVYVVPEYRKRGVYSGLYGHVKGLAESDPMVKGIRLYVDKRNTRAQEVYTKLGMCGDHYTAFEWMKS